MIRGEKVMEEQGIIEYDPPLETNIFDWQTKHLDCDAVFTGKDPRKATIYCYARDKTYNDALYHYMKKFHAEKKILMGLPAEGMWHVY